MMARTEAMMPKIRVSVDSKHGVGGRVELRGGRI